jgi:2-C-methyl-D-erythritol 4-phosphate cytidylyltransferase
LKKFVIIVAAGAGKRFKNHIPKQFECLGGKPILMHSVNAFYEAEPQIRIIIVLQSDFFQCWKDLCVKHDFIIPHTLVMGGPERFHSVKNGLSHIPDDGLVAIHDGARPLISHEIINTAFIAADKHEAVIPVIEVNDSVRITEGSEHKAAERKKLRLVQTPQVFKCSVVKKAYQQEYDLRFSDDATVVEAFGGKVRLINGSIENIKITRAQDLHIAEALLKARTLTS